MRKFCGKRNSYKFTNMTRVDVNGDCPEGSFVCNEKAEIDNRYCVTDLNNCPINGLQIIDLS